MEIISIEYKSQEIVKKYDMGQTQFTLLIAAGNHVWKYQCIFK